MIMMDYYKRTPISREDIEYLLDDYYDERGYDKEHGIPTLEKLRELDLSYMITDIERARKSFIEGASNC